MGINDSMKNHKRFFIVDECSSLYKQNGSSKFLLWHHRCGFLLAPLFLRRNGCCVASEGGHWVICRGQFAV